MKHDVHEYNDDSDDDDDNDFEKNVLVYSHYHN